MQENGKKNISARDLNTRVVAACLCASVWRRDACRDHIVIFFFFLFFLAFISNNPK